MARQPDYKLSAFNKLTEQKSPIGAAWLNDDGSIRIVLNYLTVIPPNDENLILTLFLNNDRPPVEPVKASRRRRSKVPYSDEIPF